MFEVLATMAVVGILGYALGYAFGRVLAAKQLSAGLNQATLDECLKAIDKHIARGRLPDGGNGTDPHAQRNGMILAYNILFELREQSREGGRSGE